MAVLRFTPDGLPVGSMADDSPIKVVLNVVSEPFEDDPPYATDFYDALGRMVLLWGRAEQNLDRLVLIAIHVAGKHGPVEQLPVSLDGKLTLLRKVYRDTPPLRHLKENVYSLATAIGNEHHNRASVTHSSWEGFLGDPPAITFLNFKHREGHPTVGEFRWTLARLNKTLRGINHVNARIVGLILDEVHDEARKALHKVLSLDRLQGFRPAPADLAPLRPPQPSRRSSR